MNEQPTTHLPLVDGFCPECAHEAHLAVFAVAPVDEERYEALGDHLYAVHGIKPHPYRRGDDTWNAALCDSVHHHIHLSDDPDAEQGQEWMEHDEEELFA